MSYKKDHICPGCGGNMHLMGRSFKASKRGNHELRIADPDRSLLPDEQ